MIFMTWEIFVYTLIVLGWEKVRATPSLSAMVFGNPEVKAANAPDEDEDVIAEKARLQSGGGQDDAIKIMGLRKVYKGRLGGGNKIAVQDLWMGVPKGQCLGFLGINGAGSVRMDGQTTPRRAAARTLAALLFCSLSLVCVARSLTALSFSLFLFLCCFSVKRRL